MEQEQEQEEEREREVPRQTPVKEKDWDYGAVTCAAMISQLPIKVRSLLPFNQSSLVAFTRFAVTMYGAAMPCKALPVVFPSD